MCGLAEAELTDSGLVRSVPYEKSCVEARRVSALQADEGFVCRVRTGHRPVTRRRSLAVLPEFGTRAIAMFALCVTCTAAVAGPPFLTDDPEPVDLHHAEINLIAQQSRATAGRAGTVSGEVNIGCAAETQCHFAVPVAFDQAAGMPSRAGFGDVEIGVKYRFLDRRDDGWSAAVYPTLLLPTGDAGRGLGNGRAQLLLPLWVQRSFGPWVWDAGIARLINRASGARDSWFTGLLARRSFGDRFSLGAELFHHTATAVGERSTAGFNVGAMVSVSPNHNLLISAGRGVAHVEANRGSIFVGYQLEL